MRDDVKRLAEGLDWITAWTRLDAAETVARGILAAADDPRRNDAELILAVVERVRRAYRRGRPVPAGEMDQLYRLGAAANAKIIRPLVDHAAKIRGNFLDHAQGANSQKKTEGDARRAAWQSAADEIWRRHPTWTAKAVAFQIVKDQGGNVETIRRRIKPQ